MNDVLNRPKHYKYRAVFLWAFAIALIMLLPFLIYDKGFFLYCGDFNSQQIPFATFLTQWFGEGFPSYDFGIDLGGGVINSFSFYMIGSPFFALLMLLPTAVIPYAMAPMLCVKFGVAAVCAYLYIKRYIYNPHVVLISSLLFAFCGFNVYNIFFNHFLDPVVIFPLLLYAMDEFVYNKRRGLFAGAVALCFITNYFFFMGQVVFLIIYFFAKLATREYRITLKEFGLLALESVLGVFIGGIFAIPAFVSLLDNSRSTQTATGYNLLLHGTSQQYWAIISSLFFPPDPPYMPNVFRDGAIKWTSMSFYLPVFSCAGALAFVRTRKNSAFKYIMLICLGMALVPILNSAFYVLNSSYYSRWFYMPILIMCLATGKVLEQVNTAALKKSVLTIAVVIALYSLFGLVPNGSTDGLPIGVADNTALFWLTLGTALFGVVFVYLWLVFFKKSEIKYHVLILFVAFFSATYGIIHIASGKIPQLEGDSNYKAQTYDIVSEDMLGEDEEFFRVDTFGAYDNLGLHLDLNSIQFFNSSVTPSILQFYPSVGVKRDVSSKPEWDKYALRSLLSVKYLLVPNSKLEDFSMQAQYGFVAYENNSEYTIYRNEHFLPMGLALDNYMLWDDYQTIAEAQRSDVLLKALVIQPEDYEQLGLNLERLPVTGLTTGYDAFIEDVAHLRQSTAYNFVDTGSGFTAEINMASEKPVMFAVPYDKGFTAYVDGVETDIYNVNGGLCAINVPQGEHDIEFVYQTPYLLFCSVLAFAALVGLIVYVIIARKKSFVAKNSNFHDNYSSGC